jgi:hypothetical protein
VQATLRAAPEHVFGAPRPFLLDKIAQLALTQAGAEVLPEIAVAYDMVGAGAVPTMS